MTISVTHQFVSAKADGGDATLIQPSKWNQSHTITCATGVTLGRASAGAGAVEELATSAFFQSLYNSADLTNLLITLGIGAFTSGDVKLTLKTSADSGWVMMNDGTIGDGSSGATTRANADTSTLYAVIWNNISNTWAPIYDSAGAASARGASAAADFAAHKRLALTKTLGRALAGAGAGATLTSRALGETLGAETVTLDTTMIPAHTHAVTDPGHTHTTNAAPGTTSMVNSGGGFPTVQGGNTATITSSNNTTGISVNNAGGGAAHANMQPTSFLNAMVKL